MEVHSSDRCLGCITSFQAAIATLQDKGDDKERHLIEKARDELERFSLWAGNIGALNVPASSLSLEYRLREARDILDHIQELLDDLQEAISDLQSYLTGEREEALPEEDTVGDEDEDEDEAEAIISEAGSYITRLFRITKIIRQAAPTDRFMKALSRERLQIDDHFDISHVGTKFPKLAADDQAWLRQRLGRAITHRRQFLRYTRDHHDKLGSSSNDDGLMKGPELRPPSGPRPARDGVTRGEGASQPSTFFTRASTIDPAKVSLTSLPLEEESDTEDDVKSYTTISRSVDGDLETSLSDRVPKVLDLQIMREKERTVFDPETTEYDYLSYIDDPIPDMEGALEFLRANGIDSSSVEKKKLDEFSYLDERAWKVSLERHLEKVERRARAKKEIECPFCREIKKFSNERSWRRHVYVDLRPYVCTFPDCTKPYFSDVNEWFNHEMQRHRVSYACQLCQGSRVYSSDKQYLDHVTKRHPALLVDGGEQALLDIGKQPVQQIPAEDCPCCTEWTDRLRERLPDTDASEPIHVTPVVFKRHLASHLEQLALFALPLSASNKDEQESNVALNVDKKNDDGQEVLASLNFDSRSVSRSGSFDEPVLEEEKTIPCEFAWYTNCERRFGLNQVQRWLDHVIGFHLQGQLPRETICWFCDDHKFVATSDLDVDKEACLRQRMHHIVAHLRDSPHLNGLLIRPDFPFFEHLANCRLIPQSVINQARSYSEMPPVYRLHTHTALPRKAASRSKALLPPEVTQGQRCKVYELRNDDWYDNGTGLCRTFYEEMANKESRVAYMTVESWYEPGIFLLKVAIGTEDYLDSFERQQDSEYWMCTDSSRIDTLVIWQDQSTGKEMALLFETLEGANRIWRFIMKVQQVIGVQSAEARRGNVLGHRVSPSFHPWRPPSPVEWPTQDGPLGGREFWYLSPPRLDVNLKLRLYAIQSDLVLGASLVGNKLMDPASLLRLIAVDESPSAPDIMGLALDNPHEVLNSAVVLDEALVMAVVRNRRHATTLLRQVKPPSRLITAEVVEEVLKNSKHAVGMLEILPPTHMQHFGPLMPAVDVLRGNDMVRAFVGYLWRWHERDQRPLISVKSILQWVGVTLRSRDDKVEEARAFLEACSEHDQELSQLVIREVEGLEQERERERER